MSDRDFPKHAEQAKDAAKGMARDAQGAAQDVARDAQGAAKGVARDAQDAARDAQGAAKDVARDAQGAAKNAARDAENTAKDVARDAKGAAKDAKAQADEALANDGVYDTKGFAMAAVGPLFLAAIPLTNWISQPGGFLEKGINGVVGSVGLLASAGSTSHIAQGGKVAALAALYTTVTYALTGAASAAGQAAGNPNGFDNKHPRANTKNLTGLPLRLHSAHYNLMEMFPGWAIAAALTQAIAPGDQHMINLLGLHVISKVFLFYPSYILNKDTPRSIGHLLATSSILNVLLQLARKPLV